MIAALASAAILATSVGPGPVHASVPAGAYSVRLQLTPNVASRTGTITVSLRSHGHVVAGAHVQLTVSMLDMNMGAFTLPVPERGAGTYARAFPVVGMSGRWKFRLDVRPRSGHAFSVAFADRMLG